MNKNYKVHEILNAVDIILNQSDLKGEKKNEKNKEPLKLTDEIVVVKENKNIPKDTENLILQAEEYLKK